MAVTYFNETVVHGKDYILNHYRHKKIKDKHLITTDHGAWVALDDDEFKKILRYETDDNLFKLLEEKGIILTKNNLDLIIEYYTKRYEFLFNGASLHIIIPTLRCNHKCIYCHSSAKNSNDKSYDMDKETAKKTLEFIFQTPARSITIEFQGGDSLLNFDIFKYIVLEAKEMNKIFQKTVRFALVTNLTLMTHEFIEFIENEKVEVCTSLDGPKEVHDKNRLYEGNKPTYDDVIVWMDRLDKEYNKKISALSVTTKNSLPYWKEIIDEFVKRGINSVQIKDINRLGFADSSWDNIGYTNEEFMEFLNKSLDYIIELNKKGVKIKSRYIDLILRKILTKRDPSFLDFRSPCGIVIGQLAYNYNGDIYCCDEGRNFEEFKLGNVKNNGFREVVTSAAAKSLVAASINDNLVCDQCVYKPYCGVCPVLSFAADNNIIPKVGKFSKCKIFKMQFDYVFEKLIFDAQASKIFFSWVGG